MSIEEKREALSDFTGTQKENIMDVNFLNVFYDRAHHFEEASEKPLGFYLVIGSDEKELLKMVGKGTAIGKQDDFYIFMTDKKGNVDHELTKLARAIEEEDQARIKTFDVTFWNESEGWKKQTKQIRAEHEQDADSDVRYWADRNGIDIDIIDIKLIQ